MMAPFITLIAIGVAVVAILIFGNVGTPAHPSNYDPRWED